MIDPLAEVVALLNPSARHAKRVVGAGSWHIRRSDTGQPFYCIVLEGSCRLAIDGREPIEVRSGDFILVPESYGVAMSSLVPPPTDFPEAVAIALGSGEFRIGDQSEPPDLTMLAGHCSFDSADAGLLVSLLPRSCMSAASLGLPPSSSSSETNSATGGRHATSSSPTCSKSC